MAPSTNRLFRIALALLLVLAQGQVIAHGLEHSGGGDNPVCASCVAGHTLTGANHGYWALILPLAQRFQDCCPSDAAHPCFVSESPPARAPPAAR